MIPAWLPADERGAFMARHLGQQPYARPAAAVSAVPLLGWQVLEAVLRSPRRPLDVLVVARGQLADQPPPRSLQAVRALMSRRLSVVVRGSEIHDEGLAALATAFAGVLPGEVHIQLYATPGGTNSYGWHYDFEDVFIAQTLGQKDYYLRANTVARQARLGEPLDFRVVRQERSPLVAAHLVPGDWLYIPARWWHLVKCLEDSLSISVGVMPPEALASAARIPTGWTG